MKLIFTTYQCIASSEYCNQGAEAGGILGVNTPHFLDPVKERKSERGGNKKIWGVGKNFGGRERIYRGGGGGKKDEELGKNF